MGKSRHTVLIAGLVCLVAYVMGGAGILPGVLSAAAYLDGSHQVILSECAGEFQLRLRHESGEFGVPRLQPQHRHGTVARLLCTLSSPSSQTPDHVLHVPTVFLSETTGREGLKHSGATTSGFIGAAAPLPRSGTDPGFTPGDHVFDEAHAPPQTPSLLSQVRATVLLI